MNATEYRGYHARIDFNADNHTFTGRVAGINDVVGFHGTTVAEREAAFEEAVDDYAEACAAAGKAPEKPYSGRVMFRVNPNTHARAALAAQLRGVSLNQWAEEALNRQAATDLLAG